MKNTNIVGGYRGTDAEEESEVERKGSAGKAYWLQLQSGNI
jgi:hypothetical protein